MVRSPRAISRKVNAEPGKTMAGKQSEGFLGAGLLLVDLLQPAKGHHISSEHLPTLCAEQGPGQGMS